jgi:hippurate hydrolase
MLAIKGGPTMASSDTLSITITGRGGHASSPHFALDPVPVACEIVQALQIMVTRRLDVFDPGVVTVTTISAGTANNVIPESVVIKGTIRAVSEVTRHKIHDNIRRLAETIAAAHEMSADVELGWGYPVTVNDADFADFAFDVATALVGDKAVIKMPAPVMGAEDFSYVLNKVPGSMMFLGASPDGIDPRTAPPNHSNRAVFNEATMKNGVAMYTSMALRHLGVPLS